MISSCLWYNKNMQTDMIYDRRVDEAWQRYKVAYAVPEVEREKLRVVYFKELERCERS